MGTWGCLSNVALWAMFLDRSLEASGRPTILHNIAIPFSVLEPWSLALLCTPTPTHKVQGSYSYCDPSVYLFKLAAI